MKKLLALVLALVMSMSLVTISNADFKDADEISYKEAVEVMSAVGVIAGYDNGNFGATDTLTRAQACKIIAYLDLGQKVADAISASGTVFTDVPATAWYAGYVEYCAGAGYVAGVGNGKFDPEAKVTGIQFAKMLLCVLGYKADVEGYTGGDYSLNIARDANKVDLYKGLKIVTSAALTREQAAQMAFNALQATCVKYSGGTSVSTSDGTTVTVNANRYEEDDNGDDYKGKNNKDKDAATLQLCEKLYGSDLQKLTDKSDDFGRPATKWEYDKKVVATATEDPIAVYAGADYDKDVTKDLKEDYEDGASKVYYNGGVDSKVDVKFLEKSIKGLTIEVYEDPANEDAMIYVVIEGYVAQIDEINLDDDDEVESVKFTVYEAGRAVANKTNISYTVDVEDDDDAYALIKDFEEDEYFVAFLKTGWDTNNKVNKDLLGVDKLETIEGEATAISKGDFYSGWVKIDGVKYNFANEYTQETLDKEAEGTFYLYNGLVMHFDGEANAPEDEYLFVVRKGDSSDKFSSKTYYAEVVFADGTAKTVELDTDGVKEPAMGVYSFEVDDDVYKLTKVDDSAEKVTITKGKTAVGSDTANSKTIYVSVKTKTYDTDKVKFDSATVYTGYKAVKSMTGNAYAYVKDGTAKLVYIVGATSVASDDDLIYVAGKSSSKLIEDKDLGKYYTMNAVVDGEIVEIMVADSEWRDKLDGVYNTVNTNDDGVYTEIKAVNTGAIVVKNTNFKKAADEVIKVGTTALAYADDVNVFVIDADGDITTGSINRNYSNVNVTYTVNDDGEVTNLYIVKLA